MYSALPKPQRSLPKNKLGLTMADYRGGVSTLCGGCGHDAVSHAIMQACFELPVQPHELVKFSGIGCSSKTPGYFVSGAHGFNAVHGRMPALASGAYLAAPHLKYLAVSGDGDTGSIGIGQFIHVIRRQIPMLYILQNNGVYGLTKGQFSATADPYTLSRRGAEAGLADIDLPLLAIDLGASFVARGFSADTDELVDLIKEGLSTPGFCFLDVVSPCVSFNNHDGSTKSYHHTREAFARPKRCFSDREQASLFLRQCRQDRKVPLGRIFALESPSPDERTRLRDIPLDQLTPGLDELDKINSTLR